jgi:hypothetical protein
MEERIRYLFTVRSCPNAVWHTGSPVVGVECLQLSEISVEGRHVFRSDTNKGANFQDFAWSLR